MNKKGNAKALNEYNNQKKEQTRQRVLDAIERVYKSDKKFTLENVIKEAGVSRAYFTKNKDMMDLINKYRDNYYVCRKRTTDTKDVLIKAQEAKIKKLEKENKLLLTNINYKQKYEEALNEIERLNDIIKRQLEDRINDII